MKQIFAAIPVMFLATLLEAQAVCEPATFSMESDKVPAEIGLGGGNALAALAREFGCEMPEFLFQEVPVRFRGGEIAGVLQGFVNDTTDETAESGYWVIMEDGNDKSVIVPSIAGKLGSFNDAMATLQLQNPAGTEFPLTDTQKIDETKLGYVRSDQVVAVNAGFWPSNRYEVTFLSEPNAGMVHRGDIAKQATEWTVLISQSALSDYRIVSSNNEVCLYQDAEIKTNELTRSATFRCRFEQE